jgi:hypothetical protein
MALRTVRTAPARRRLTALAGLLAAVALPAGVALPAAASAATTPNLIYGTLDTQTSTAATEAKAGVSMAMFELNWSSFEPTQGVVSSSYLATMNSELAAYQAAGQKVTLGLGLQNPPSWVFSLADSRYVNQDGTTSSEANFVFSQAARPPTPRSR